MTTSLLNSESVSEYVIGVDESGTGAWAGSFYVCAVLARSDWGIPGLRDSKKTNARQRLRLVEQMEQELVLHFEGAASPEDIVRYGHAGAYTRAFEDVVSRAKNYLPRGAGALVIVDGLPQRHLERVLDRLCLPRMFMKQADNNVQHVSAASIFAKFSRDMDMLALDTLYPQYKFAYNAGYGTADHIAAIEKHGYVENVHRPMIKRRRT